MPPKQKAATKISSATPAKKIKSESQDANSASKREPLMRKKVHKLDNAAENQFVGGSVLDDYDCMLNQTNIGFNNNKYYLIQLVTSSGKYHVWTRWGRVGELGRNLTSEPFTTVAEAVTEFEEKFKSKTKNKWGERYKFVSVEGQYTLLEMADDDVEDKDEDTQLKITETDKEEAFEPSMLDMKDMLNYALAQLKLDTTNLPLGGLSKPQIMKGFEVLEKLQEVICKNKKGNLVDLSSQFYTIIPHVFGRQVVPPTISSAVDVREKLDLLLVLADIESTQSLLKTHDKTKKTTKLDIELNILDKKSEDFKSIQEYVQNNKSRDITIVNVWNVHRKSEEEEENSPLHKDIFNRKVLWHGTTIAEVAAILKSGERIMPHSGGRVDKVIYLASENAKWADYGVMFINQVALGKKKMIMPVGKPENRDLQSSFHQREYLVYNESQCRIRYLLLCKFC